MTVTELTRNAVRPTPHDTATGAGTLEEAFARLQSELLGTLYYLVGNIEDARDAYQDAFVKCWKHRQQVDGVNNLKAWIFRIALNTGRDLRQSAWRRKRHAMPEDEAMITSTDAGPQQDAQRHENVARLRGALRGLRPEEQEVFLLRQNGDLTYEEIGDAIGLPTGTVKTRMRLALTKLRKALRTD